MFLNISFINEMFTYFQMYYLYVNWRLLKPRVIHAISKKCKNVILSAYKNFWM